MLNIINPFDKATLVKLLLERVISVTYFQKMVEPDSPTVYVPTSYPDSKYRHVSYYSRNSYTAAVSRLINSCFQVHDAQTLLLVLKIFEVETFDIECADEYATGTWATFVFDVFPYACFKGFPPQEFHFNRFLNQWLWGSLEKDTKEDIANLFRYNDSDIQRHVQVLEMVGFRHMSKDVLTSVLVDPGSPIPLYLSNRYIGNLNVDKLIDYVFMAPQTLKWPKPVWAIEDHRNLDPLFLKISKTILCMRKYQFRKFPVSKDLIPLVLKHLFPLHLEWLEKRLKTVRQEVTKLKETPLSNLTSKMLDEAQVFIYFRNVDKIRDAVLIRRKLPIDPFQKAKYRIEILGAMTTHGIFDNVTFGFDLGYKISNMCNYLTSDFCKLNADSKQYRLMLEVANFVLRDIKLHKFKLSQLASGKNMLVPYNVTDAMPMEMKARISHLWSCIEAGKV